MSLLGDVSSRIFDELPDETWFYLGHGDDSTLGAERSKLAGGANAAGERPAACRAWFPRLLWRAGMHPPLPYPQKSARPMRSGLPAEPGIDLLGRELLGVEVIARIQP
jgi:hypothetical protein